MTKDEHDFIIIGAGTAGITLGYLLEKYGHDVIVLEAGEDKDNDPNIRQIKSFYNLEDNFHNEYFWLENGKPNSRLPNDHNHFSGGRLWGGSSSINESIYWRGAQKTYDQWGGYFADPDFCADAFRKLETYHGKTENPHLRGKNGPFHVIQSDPQPIGIKYSHALKTTLKNDFSLDIPLVEDIHTHNGPAIGITGQHFLKPGSFERVSSSNTLLKDKKSSLDIRSQSTTTRILFEGKTAIGVEYIQKGQTRRSYARKKVIVCAGPRSPAILMHSGIGSAAHLNELEIDLIHDNPHVGQNLTNHLLVPISIQVPEKDNMDISRCPHFKGATSFSAIPDTARGDLSDIDMEFATMSSEPGKALILTVLVNPGSRGSVSLFSNDPLHPIIVDTNYLSDPNDAQKLERALILQERTIQLLHKMDPHYQLLSDLTHKSEYIKNKTVHIHHWTGTCQIGKVIDTHLNVLGVQNLMVADTSAIPEITRGHTYAPALLLGIVAFKEITQMEQWDF